jgi:hypothetical protein
MILREEYRLKIHGNKILKIIFDPKIKYVKRSPRKTHKEEPPNLHLSPSISRVIRSWRMDNALDRMGKKTPNI